MPGERFGPYHLEELIGRGGMGEVFRAVDTQRKRTVAVKRLPPVLAEDPSYQRRFRSESEIAARLRSAHVIPIHDYGEIDGRLYIDMRLVKGEDLSDRLSRCGPMAAPDAVDILGQTASALDAAHAMNLVHRDVKPSNILLSPEDGRDGRDFVYLVDFGIARAMDQMTGLTGTGSAIGTPDYMAPERFEGRPADPAVDIYALACVLHEMLTGRSPFRRDSPVAIMYAHVHVAPPRASQLKTGVPTALDEVIARGLAKDPRQRFATAGELAAAAFTALTVPVPVAPRRATARHRSPTSPPPMLAPESKPPRSRRGRITAVVLAAAVLGAGGVIGTRALQEPDDRPGTSIPTTSAGKVVQIVANLSVAGASNLLVDPTGSKLLLSTPNSAGAGADVEIHDVADTSPVTTVTVADERVDALAETSDGSTVIAAGSTSAYGRGRPGNTLSFIDPAAGRVTSSVPLPSAATAIALSPDDSRVYLTDRTGSLQVWDRSTRTNIAVVPLGGQGADLAVSADGRQVYVAGTTGLKTVDTASNTVTGTIGLRDNPAGIALAPDGRTAVVITTTNDSAVGVDLTSGGVTWTAKVGDLPDSVVVTPDGQQALVANGSDGGVTIIDLTTGTTSLLPVGDSARDITLSPKGDFGFVVASDVVRFNRQDA